MSSCSLPLKIIHWGCILVGRGEDWEITSGQTWTCVPSGNEAHKWGDLLACATVPRNYTFWWDLIMYFFYNFLQFLQIFNIKIHYIHIETWWLQGGNKKVVYICLPKAGENHVVSSMSEAAGWETRPWAWRHKIRQDWWTEVQNVG